MTATIRRLALAGALCAPAASAGAAEPLQPFQMVRSLQLVQDRIAAGDHAALPMQKKLLELIDQRFRAAGAGDFEDKRNFRAVLVYGMSGGNPATLRKVMSELHLEPADEKIGNGILGYVTGQPKKAQVALAGADPLSFAPELGSFVALVKAATVAVENPKAALPLLDQARLLAPGTLVDEAALRRSIDLSATLGEPVRFLRGSGQYVRRYLRSPYASQFADSFVAGVIGLHASLKLEDVAAITALMSPEQEKVIYLRIARRAVIEGLNELSAFASAKAEGVDPALVDEDPRALLYSSLATVTSADMPDLLARLDRIDRSKLTSGDRELLDAVRTVATEVVSPVEPAADAPAAATLDPGAIAETAPPPGTETPEQAHTVSETAPSGTPSASPGHAEMTDPAQPAPTEQQTAAEPAAEETFVSDARAKLDAIDKLLGDTIE